jgi:Flp pilus assembly protein TadD
MLSAGRRVLSHLIFAAVMLAALLAVSSYAQAPPSIPPDVQAIMNKLSSGGTPTPQEQQRLQDWGQSMAKGMTSSGAASGGASPSNGSPLQGQPGTGKISFTQLCPKPSSAALPSTAPTAAEYLALVKTLATRYGAKLDAQTRIGIDGALTQAGANAGSLAALLVVAGAINEAVYAGAVAAQRNPLDVNAANNLGVSLDQASDYPDAARVFLYLTSLRPQSPLANVNLAWAYFNAGASAAAKKQFVHAQSLGPDMAAPEEGQGLIAGCQGDMASAKTLLGSSLKKGYSSAGAVGFMAAQRAQPSSATDAGWTPPDSDPPPDTDSMIPDLKVPEQMEYSPDYAAALAQLSQHSQSRLADLGNQIMAAGQRVAAIKQRFQQQGDSAINLPLTFEAELFEWKEVTDLAYTARFRNVDQVNKEVTQAMNANGETILTTVGGDLQQLNQVQQRQIQLLNEMQGCGDNQACWDKYDKELKEVQAQIDQVNYQMCLHSEQSIDVDYTQSYKLWKTQWDDFRPASADLYAFTDPILNRVWVPALNEFLSLQREAMVLAIYTPLAGAASGLVAMGDAYKDMKCVPPPPKESENQAKDPDLPKETPPPCPLGNGIGFGLLVVSVHLGCDSASIEGGEALKFKASRNFSTHCTTLWAGVGAGASAGFDAPMLGSMTPKASLSAEAGVGITIGQNGTVSDVFVSSELSAKVSAGKIDTGPISLPQPGTSIGMSASGVLSLENGASLSGNIAGFGGTIHQ